MKYEYSCGCVIFAADGGWKILLTQNLKGGHWSFPKGHIESGETQLQTAKREVLEETGLRVEPEQGFSATVKYSPKPGCMKTVRYFATVVDIDSKLSLQPEEVSAARWLPLDDAGTALSYRNDRKVLQKAREFIESRSAC